MYTYIRHCGLCPTKLKLGPPRPNSTEQFDSPFETGSLQSILGTVLNIDIIYIYTYKPSFFNRFESRSTAKFCSGVILFVLDSNLASGKLTVRP